MTQLVEEKYVESVKQAVNLSKELEQSTMGEASEVLKTHMQIKQEQGTSEVVSSNVGASGSGNIAQPNFSEHIDLDSPSHTYPHIDDQPLSFIYSNIQKAKTPTLTPKLRPIPYQDDAPKKTKLFDQPNVIPIQTLLPGEEFDGNTIIPQEYLDSQAKLDELDTQRVKLDYETHILESRLRAIRDADAASSVFGSSS